MRPDLTRFIVRSRGLLTRLRIRPDTDVAAVTDYWDKGRRRKSIAPIIESIRESGGGLLDVAHILPALPRSLLFTYPTRAEAHLDCHWTAFNFLSDEPDDRLLDEAWVRQVIEKDYVDVTEMPHEFGDLVLFITKESTLFHSCVYIAGDIVFTKNGFGVNHPWNLMRLNDVRDLYVSEEGFQITFVRNRAWL